MADQTFPEAVIDFPEITSFDPTKKKKKKKQKNMVAIRHHVDDSLLSLVERADMLSLSERGRDVYPGLLKKTGPEGTKSTNTWNDYDSKASKCVYDGCEDVVDKDRLLQQSKYPREGNESDYQYKELLLRIFSFLHGNGSELAGDRRRTVLKPPIILPEGTADTVFVNFVDLCKTMHRPLEHVTTFMLKELGTVGSLDGENKMVVRGSFPPKTLEDVLQKYMSEYVVCNCCKSPDTILTKEKDILLLQCDMCGTERPVAHFDAYCTTQVKRRKTGSRLHHSILQSGLSWQ